MMRVLMLSPGTRGDVAPAAGLAAAFVADGHDVTIVANAEYASLVADAGCRLAPISASLLPDPEAVADRGRLQGMRAHLASLRNYMDHAANAALAAAPGAEAIVANAISPYGHDIAEGLNVPSVEALLQPMHPSAAYPPMIAAAHDLNGFNRPAGRLAARMPTPYDPACARIRSELGLPPEGRRAAQRRRRAQRLPVHHGISPAVLPRPRDWPTELSLDGFWWPHQPEGWTPPHRLATFLAAGPAPVVISLGSMPAGSVVVEAVAEACRDTKARLILQGDGLREIADRLDLSRVIHVGDVPHGWLLPQAAAVVHHAGAGMVSAALRAGVPSVPMPSHTDQPYWARRLLALKAATDPIPMKHADGARLAAAISVATSSHDLREGARAVRDALADEDGTLPLRAWLHRVSS